MVREMYKKLETSKHIEPCPFCGYPAELWEYEPVPGHFQKVVMCTNLDNQGEDEDKDDCGCPMYMPPNGFYKATKREAILIWNNRAPAI